MLAATAPVRHAVGWFLHIPIIALRRPAGYPGEP
jgi:hypothetical protein